MQFAREGETGRGQQDNGPVCGGGVMWVREGERGKLQTKRGTKLLTGGWWGLARKINYTGKYARTLILSYIV